MKKIKKRVDLYKLKLPQDLKKLNYSECEKIGKQIRIKMINTVAKSGGHLASSLGTVELTLALHRVFDSPEDKIVWDVGHQAYTHKMLTGRLGEFDTIRQENGLSGFTRTDESEHDVFISGHSSIAVSAALGMAEGMKIQGNPHHAIAVIGDGASTGGVAFEGINNAGKSNTNIIVILNHNEMSISKNVGGFAKYLSLLRSKQSYIKTKSVVERAIANIPVVGKHLKGFVKTSKDAFKNAVLHTTLFEDMGFVYLGPIDGHNQSQIEEALQTAKMLKRPVYIHLNTIKGKGYPPAESNPGEYHGVGKFEIKTGNTGSAADARFSLVFGKYLNQLANDDDKICAITAAMKYGTGLQYFKKNHKNRFFDVGIAEQHATTFAAGLAKSGMLPVFAVYSSFLQRSYDQLLHDISIDQTHVVLAIDRAGIVGEDGETHQGVFDVPFLTTIPKITIFSPSCYGELKICLKKALYEEKGLVAVRYPRGSESSISNRTEINSEYSLISSNSKILVITYGREFDNVVEASEILKEKNITIDVLKLVKIFPISNEVIDIARGYEKVYFFEEGMGEGSISQKMCAILDNLNYENIVTINDFVKHSTVDSAIKRLSLDSESVAELIIKGEKC